MAGCRSLVMGFKPIRPGHRQSLDDPAHGVHDERGLAELREVARTRCVELPTHRGEGDCRAAWFADAQISHLFRHLSARWSKSRGHNGERHVGEWRGVLDLATRVIDPASLVEPAIPAHRIADLEDGVQGTHPAGMELGHRPVVGVRHLDHHHATDVLRQSPREELHVQPAERVTEQEVRRGSLDHRQQVAQGTDDQRTGLRLGRSGASADAWPVMRDDHAVAQQRPEHPAPPVKRSAGPVDEDDRGRARARRDVLDRRASHLGQSSGRERGQSRWAHEFARSLHSAIRRAMSETRASASLPSSSALSAGSARR